MAGRAQPLNNSFWLPTQQGSRRFVGTQTGVVPDGTAHQMLGNPRPSAANKAAKSEISRLAEALWKEHAARAAGGTAELERKWIIDSG